MQASDTVFTLGPLLFSYDRLIAALAAMVFLSGAGFLATAHYQPRFSRWAWSALLVGLLAARLAFVFEHVGVYAEAPLDVLAIWRGGLRPAWGLLLAALFTLAYWWRQRDCLRDALLTLATGSAVYIGGMLLLPMDPPQPLPDISLSTLDGAAVDIAATDGRVTVINLWATWCPPCRRELPALVRAASERRDVRLLLVAEGEDPRVVLDYVRSLGLSTEHVLVDPGAQLAIEFGVIGFPTTLFFDAGGVRRRTHTGEISRAILDSELPPSPD